MAGKRPLPFSCVEKRVAFKLADFDRSGIARLRSAPKVVAAFRSESEFQALGTRFPRFLSESVNERVPGGGRPDRFGRCGALAGSPFIISRARGLFLPRAPTQCSCPRCLFTFFLTRSLKIPNQMTLSVFALSFFMRVEPKTWS